MNSQHHCDNSLGHCAEPQISRSPRFNLPVTHPSRWQLLLDQLLASPMRLHRYRDLSRRIVEDTMLEKDCGSDE